MHRSIPSAAALLAILAWAYAPLSSESRPVSGTMVLTRPASTMINDVPIKPEGSTPAESKLVPNGGGCPHADQQTGGDKACLSGYCHCKLDVNRGNRNMCTCEPKPPGYKTKTFPPPPSPSPSPPSPLPPLSPPPSPRPVIPDVPIVTKPKNNGDSCPLIDISGSSHKECISGFCRCSWTGLTKTCVCASKQ